MHEIRMTLFGFPRIEMDGQPVEVDTRKATALLAYLALNSEPQSRDVLAGLLWPDYDQTGARAALRRTLSVLNRATGESVLEISRERVGIAAGTPLWLDVRQFQETLLRCEQMDTRDSPAYLASLTASVNLARERFMAGFSLRDAPGFDDWQFFQAENLSRSLSGALEKLARAYAAAGVFDRAIEYARAWLAQDSLLEDAHRLLMLLYAQSGQRNAALRQYRECVRILDQELGVAPLPETSSLNQSILENRLQPPEEHRLVEPPVSVIEEPEPGNLYPLVGRESELDTLRRAYSAAHLGGKFILLEGEAGIGKTRLADEFLAGVRQKGGRVLVLRCYEGEAGLAYAPFISGLSSLIAQPDAAARLGMLSPQVLAEAVRLVPEIGARFRDLPPAAIIEGPGAQSRFFESLRQLIFAILSGDSPGVLFLDDVQWADTASLDLLAFVLRRLAGSGVLVLATWRADLSTGNPHLSQMINDQQRSGSFLRIPLDRLSPDEIERLARAAAGSTPLPLDFAGRLYDESEGLPFFVVEYLGSVLKNGSSLDGDWDLPSGVRDVLQHRLAGVDDTARQLLSAASVIGRSFRFDTLREVSGRSELETISGLESLLARGIIIEHMENTAADAVTYDFTHARLRDLVYDETSRARCRLLHRRTADALVAALGRRDPGSAAGGIAQHYLLSGQYELAASFYRQAGDHARRLYANRDALAHYQAAIAAGHPDTAGLHEALGDLHTLLGEYRAAIQGYETAASLCTDACLPALERKLGNVHARLGNWDLAESQYRAALESMSSGACDLCQPAGVYADWSHVAYQRGNQEEARRLAGQALELAEQGRDPLSLARAHNISAILARNAGDYEAAIYHLNRCLEIARQEENDSIQIAALNNLARVYDARGDLDTAIRLARTALEICQRLGDRHREAALLNNLADLLYNAGQGEQSMELLKQAVTIFAEIGGQAGPENVEIWKLTEW